jgi:hypothetical protein
MFFETDIDDLEYKKFVLSEKKRKAEEKVREKAVQLEMAKNELFLIQEKLDKVVKQLE